ncbi:MAG: cysteine desulfurase family protein, partial [Candidatus Ranarchaeia archaeon]
MEKTTSTNSTSYLDYSAGAPVDPEVIKKMIEYQSKHFGNASSLHQWGLKVKDDIVDARKVIADTINAELPKEIIFTSSPTESNNLALIGIASRLRKKGNHIITLTTEHLSILTPLKKLQKDGFEVTRIPVDSYGILDIEKLKESITDKTIMITIQSANGEIGTLQPIKEINEIAQEKKIFFHSDGT